MIAKSNISSSIFLYYISNGSLQNTISLDYSVNINYAFVLCDVIVLQSNYSTFILTANSSFAYLKSLTTGYINTGSFLDCQNNYFLYKDGNSFSLLDMNDDWKLLTQLTVNSILSIKIYYPYYLVYLDSQHVFSQYDIEANLIIYQKTVETFYSYINLVSVQNISYIILDGRVGMNVSAYVIKMRYFCGQICNLCYSDYTFDSLTAFCVKNVTL